MCIITIKKVFCLLFILLFLFGLGGCKKSADNSSSSDTTFTDFYVDKETGEIIDALTGEKTDNENLVIDEKTGDIVDTSTGKTYPSNKNGGGSHGDKGSSSQQNGTDKNSTTSSKNDTPSKNDTSSNKDNTPSEGNKPNNQPNDNIKLPTSSKKVSFNRQRLYDRMVSSYPPPKLMYKELKSYDEYVHEIKKEIPSNHKDLYEWYFNIIDKNGPVELVLPNSRANDVETFKADTKNVVNFNLGFFKKPVDDNHFKIFTSKESVKSKLEKGYESYCNRINEYNEGAKITDAENMAYYNNTISYLKDNCDMVESAIKKANIKNGENEISAITKIINYICDNCRYWTEVENENDGHGQWIRECLSSGTALCNGYAKTFYAMCYYCGIDVRYYSGNAGGEAHSWNAIKIGNTEYFFDITWYDIQRNGLQDAQHIWCNGSEFNKTHNQNNTEIKYW